jgi:nucleoside 2-deoxyribosyltransferase
MNPLRIYIACPYRFKAMAEFYAARVEEMGHAITHKWWNVEAPPNPQDLMMRVWAAADLEGVLWADYLWVLAQDHGVGTWVEMGYALALSKPVIVTGPFRTIFSKLAAEWPAHEDGLRFFERLKP